MQRLAEVIRQLGTRGFYLGPDWSSPEALELATELGVPRGDLRDGRTVRTISPQDPSSATPNTLSSRYGFGAFPLHTETAYWRRPVRWLMLRCMNPGSGSRITTVVDFHQVFTSPDLRRQLCNEVWIVTARRPFLATLAREKGHELAFRLDRECMEPITRGAHQLSRFLDRVLPEVDSVEVRWRFNDLLVIDNYRCLHGRGESNIPDPDRQLERILVGVKP